MVLYCHRLPADGGYVDLNRDMSVCSMPVTHGLTAKTGSVYESAAYFLRNNVTGREFLFFGDVEPDSISSKPQTINVWKVAASKIPYTLSSVFIECSWTSDRPDNLLFGHLNPMHLADELVALALEVYKVKNNLQSASLLVAEGGKRPDTRARKRKRLNPVSLDSLRGVLNGVTVYIMHCKSDVGGKYDEPIDQIIGAEVRALVEKKGLGVEVVVLEQGTRIRELHPFTQASNNADVSCPCQRYELAPGTVVISASAHPLSPGFDIRFFLIIFRPSICFLGFIFVVWLCLSFHILCIPLQSFPLVSSTICSFMFFILITVYLRCLCT